MPILLLYCIDYTSILYVLGICGMLINSRNVLLMLLSLELTFLSSALNFIFFSVLLNSISGFIYGILIIIVVVADTSIGLSLVVLIYSGVKSTSVNYLITLRG